MKDVNDWENVEDDVLIFNLRSSLFLSDVSHRTDMNVNSSVNVDVSVPVFRNGVVGQTINK
eukprot:Awhi_evm1s10582